MAYRVIQWATGSVGREALRAILIHPELELAGVYVYSADKSGCDRSCAHSSSGWCCFSLCSSSSDL